MGEDNERISVLGHVQDTRKPDRRGTNFARFVPMSSVAQRLTYVGSTHNNASSVSSPIMKVIGRASLLVTSALGRCSVI